MSFFHASYYNSQFVCLLGNYSQAIGPKGLNLSGFDGSHPGVVIRKFGKDQSKTLPVGLFFFLLEISGRGHNSMPE